MGLQIVFNMKMFAKFFLVGSDSTFIFRPASLLQDRITPFSNEVAFNTIEQELGQPIDKLFSEISLEPVAAASLGQVLILVILSAYHVASFAARLKLITTFHYKIFI